MHPTSLRQFILAGFYISLIPLAFLLWQSTSVLRKVSQSSLQYTQASINFVRNAESSDRLLDDIERSIRQYKIVKTQALNDIALDHLAKYQQAIGDLCLSIENILCSIQIEETSLLTDEFSKISPEDFNSRFSQIRKNQSLLSVDLWKFIDETTDKQENYIEEQLKNINLLLILLVLCSAILIFWMSGYLVKPVKILEEKIQQIGNQTTGKHPQIKSIQGAEEFKRVYKHLDWLDARLYKLETLRQAFLRHAAHELKTPLSSIKEGCSILSEHIAGPINAQQHEVVNLLDEGASRLQHLTEKLLEYDFLLQQQEPSLKEINLKTLIEECAVIYNLAFTKRQQTLLIDCSINQIQSDERLLTRIIDNLLSNAQAYGNVGGNVKIELSKEDAYINLKVANTGNKVQTKDKDTLFLPFQRGIDTRADTLKSTGLGLSIVQDCAQLLGGKAEFVTYPGYDFCVSVTLPTPSLQT